MEGSSPENVLLVRDMAAIMRIMHESTGRKIVVASTELRPLAYAGFTREKIEKVKKIYR